MSDAGAIAAWLRAQFDDDAKGARDAMWCDDVAAWSAHPGYGTPPQSWYVIDALDDRVVEVRAEASDDEGVARHMARWDPARVLAEVEAKRAILAEHAPSDGEDPVCGRCTFHRSVAACRAVPYPCHTVKLLAAPYAGRPGWQECWALR